MALFDNPKKELHRLQEQLLQEEDWFARELDEAKMMIGEAPGKQAKKPAAKAPASKPAAPKATASRTTASRPAAPKAPTAKTAAAKTAAAKTSASQRSAAAPKTPPRVRNYANGYGAVPAPAPRVRNIDALPEKAPVNQKKDIKGLVLLAILETAGILGIVAYWLLVLL